MKLWLWLAETVAVVAAVFVVVVVPQVEWEKTAMEVDSMVCSPLDPNRRVVPWVFDVRPCHQR